jgi:predicted esterase
MMNHLSVRKTARYYTLGDATSARDIWFVCHGYEQLASAFIEDFRVLDDGSNLIVAPEALNRFYPGSRRGPHGPDSRIAATWMTREDRETEIADYVAYLDALYDHVCAGVERARIRVHAFGFSQGAATASRWVVLGSSALDTLILWGAGLPPDLPPEGIQRLRKVELLVVAGTRDEYVSAAALEQAAQKMKADEIGFELVRFEGGHRIDHETLSAISSTLRSAGQPTHPGES